MYAFEKPTLEVFGDWTSVPIEQLDFVLAGNSTSCILLDGRLQEGTPAFDHLHDDFLQ